MSITVYIVLAFVGATIIAMGGLFASRFWEKYFLSPTKKQKQISTLWLAISLIAMLVGGFLSTYYWNQYFDLKEHDNQCKALVRMLAAEFVYNASILGDHKFRDQEEESLSVFVVYPKFQTTALEAAISSGAFSGEHHKKLLSLAFHLNEILHEVNYRLVFTEQQMASNPKPKNIYMWRKDLSEGLVMKQLTRKLFELGEMLTSKYGVSREERFFDES